MRRYFAMQPTSTAASAATIFSSAFLSGLAGKHGQVPVGKAAVLRSYAELMPGGTLGDACNAAYEDLRLNYRNEYFFKNTIISKILLGRHSVRTASALLEVPTGNSIADVVVLNGTSTVYEIKTDLDSFTRLPSQLEDYRTTFEHTNVVVSDTRAAAAEAVVPRGVGILAIRKRGTLAVIRPSESSMHKLRQERMFQVLRRNEALSALQRAIGYEIDVPPGDLWGRCRELFVNLPLEVAHQHFLCELRARGMKAAPLMADRDFPLSLRALAYATALTRVGQTRLVDRLSCSADQILDLTNTTH
jgi:hypothetical protein